MKKLYGFLVGLSLILLNCTNSSQNIDFVPKLVMPPDSPVTDSVLKILDDYSDYLNNNKYIVYQIFINQDLDSIIYYLTFIQYYKELDQYQPTGYINTDNGLFLVYSGIEKLLSNNPEFNTRLKNELSNILLKNDDEPPFILEQWPWSIVYYLKNKSLKINKKAYCPYGWPKSDL
jgi:hypothetical protein